MATDINQVISSAQEAINSAIEAISETQITQNLLREDMQTADAKIAVHNTDAVGSHEDIRQRLEDMPSMITNPVITGPSAIETGEEGTWHVTASGVIPTVTISSFEFTDNNGQTTTVTCTDGTSVDYVHTFTGSRNEHIEFSVVAKGTYDYVSKPVSKSLLITQHLPPDVSGMTTTIPAVISANNTYSFVVSGITDLDDDFVNYTLACNDDAIILPAEAATGMTQGATYQFTVPADHFGTATVVFTVTATDAKELSNSKTISVRLNGKPITTGMSHTIPAHLAANSNYTFRVSGVTDPDNDAMTYSITSSNAHITFNKSSGISQNEDVIVTVGDIAPTTSYTFTLTFTDSYGASTSTTITDTINSAPDLSSAAISIPARVSHGKTYAFTITGIADTDDNISDISLTNATAGVTFNIASGLSQNTEYTMLVSDSLVGPGTISLTLQVTDNRNAVTTKVITAALNSDPNVTGWTHNIPTHLSPNASATVRVAGVTDIDGDAITFDVMSNNNSITFSKNTGISLNEDFSINVGDIIQGTSYTLTFTFKDELGGTAVTTVTSTINKLPVMSDFVIGLPTRFVPGTTYDVSLGGATDADGEDVIYNITNLNTDLTISKVSSIAEDESVTFLLAANAERVDRTISISAVDVSGGVSTVTATLVVNKLPVTNMMSSTIPTKLAPNTTYSCSVAGVIDPNGDTVTFSIASPSAYITFSKSSGIALNETFDIIVGAATAGDHYDLVFAFADSYNETTTTMLSSVFNTAPSISNMSVVFNSDTYKAPDTGTVVISGATDSDTDQTITYSIDDANDGIIWSKTSGITEAELVSFTIKSTAARGSYPITVSANDGSVKVGAIKTLNINLLPDLTGLSNDIPKYVAPGVRIPCTVWGATDANGGVLTYTVTCANSNVVIEQATGITANSVFYITPPTAAQLARGDIFTLQVAVSDGSECVFGTISCTQNNLPVVNDVTLALPASGVYGGTCNQITLAIPAATDNADNAVTMSLASTDGITFSKSTGIAANENVVLTFPKVKVDTALTFTLDATDSTGESCATPKTFSVVVHPIVVVRPSIFTNLVTGDAIDAYGDNGFTMTWTDSLECIYIGDADFADYVPTTAGLTADFVALDGSSLTA